MSLVRQSVRPPCLPLRGRWHPPLSRPEGLASRREADDGGSRSPLRCRHEHRSSAPALLSLRTSDRCHWCGNPSAFPCRSHARQQTEGLSRPPLCHGFAQAKPKSTDLTKESSFSCKNLRFRARKGLTKAANGCILSKLMDDWRSW